MTMNSSHARCNSGKRASSIGMGHAAAIGLLEMWTRAQFRCSDREESSTALRFLTRVEPSSHWTPSESLIHQTRQIYLALNSE